VRGCGDGGNDAPSGEDATVNNLFRVFRARHQLSPATSEERPMVRRKRRSMCVVSRAESDLKDGRGSSETTSGLYFISSDGASPKSL